MSTNLQELVGQLTGTMSPDAQARNAATQYLKAKEQQTDLAVSLLLVSCRSVFSLLCLHACR
jgi:hypothetical protein